MATVLEIRWEFTPKTLFEEKLSCEVEGCTITFDDGVVLASLPLEPGQARSPQREAIGSYVESLFLGAQVVEQTPYDLGHPSLFIVGDDGSRGCIIEAQTGHIRLTGRRADLRYTRPDGTVVDTRRDRIDRKHRIANAAARYGSSEEALARMLRSYRCALMDAHDELIHLYEVLDTLKSKFGTQAEAQRKLGVPKPKWSRLGRLCNDLPLRQGRHRGQVQQPIRDATSAELDEARRLAAEFIEAYVDHLERVK